MGKGVSFVLSAINSTQKAFATVKSDLNDIDKKLDKLGLSFKGLSIAAAAAFAGAAIKNAIDLGSRVNDLTLQFNISAEALTRLAYAGQQNGIEMDSMASNMGKMVKGISEAATGSGTAKIALDELGLSAAKLNEMTPEQQMYVLADSFKDVTNENDKARLAMDIFGKSGAEMLRIMGDGSDTLREMTAESDKLSNTMSGPQAEALDSIGDSFDRLSAAVGGVAKDFTAAMAPAIVWVTDLFTKLFEIIDQMGKDMGATIHFMTDGFIMMGEKLGLVDKGLSDIAKNDALNVANKDAEKLNKTLDKTEAKLAPGETNDGKGGKGKGGKGKGTKKTGSKAYSEKQDMPWLYDTNGKKYDEKKDLPWLYEGSKKMDEVAKKAKETSKIFEDSFGGALEKLSTDFGNWRNIAKDAFGSIVSGFAKQGMQDVMGAVSSGFSSMGGFSGMASGVGSMFSGGFGGFFANGGNLKAGQWGIVGENGPEIIHGGSAGIGVSPNGGRPVNVHFNINTPNVDSFRRSQTQITAQAVLALRGAGRNL